MKIASGIFSWVLLAACLSCTPIHRSEPDPGPPRPAPIPLGPEGSHPIIFQRVVFRIPSGTRIGEVRMRGRVIDEMKWSQSKGSSSEFNVGVTDEMRRLGYEMRDAADSLFDPSGTVKVRFEMAAVLHEAELDFDYRYDHRTYSAGEGDGRAIIKLEVQLFDGLRKKNVYSRTFTGRGRDKGLKPNPIVSAVQDAVAQVAGDPEFVAIVARTEETVADSSPDVDRVPTVEKIALPTCDPQRGRVLPERLPDVMQSIVEVRVGRSEGTGVIVSSDGYILTAAHLIGDGDEVWIQIHRGPQLRARIVRKSHPRDVALLKLDGRGYDCSPVDSNDSDIALGSDLFLINPSYTDSEEQTVSRGVLSGYAELDGWRYIQTDGSINPGSSGGPILDGRGRVIGITVQKFAGIGIEGLGLGVPIPDVKRALWIEFAAP